MQFHDYIALRNRIARSSAASEEGRAWAKKKKPDEFRKQLFKLHEWARADTHTTTNEIPASAFALAVAEDQWVEGDRPYYNIWPVASELASSVKLDLPFSAIDPQLNCILLRFAKGFEPFAVKASMVVWTVDQYGKRGVVLLPVLLDENVTSCSGFFVNPDDSVEDWLKDVHAKSNDSNVRSQYEHLIRLTVFVGLLANDRDIITPIVLAKDQRRYGSATDEDVRVAIERRAMRRLGRGCDVGKALQFEKAQSPHWRNPHLALYWTGKGRLKPIVKMRSGAIIHRVSMSEVPTGYLGPETIQDAELVEEIQRERVAISTKKRFEIFKRDNYRCRLCGAKADDGAALHVDHRQAISKGGGNDNDNLWTLCDRCNLGKSNAVL